MSSAPPSALITGITGQDGSYLTELLLEKGYVVHGMVRHSGSPGLPRLGKFREKADESRQGLHLHHADLTDATTMRRILLKVNPDELYHLAGQSHVGLSFEIPESTCELTAMGTLKLLEILRDMPRPPRFFNAASSEVFGQPTSTPQTEDTPVRPTSPYGVAKAFAMQMTSVYRRAFGLFACNGILYNHESSRRSESFVTRKICRAAAAISLKLQEELSIGDTSARRDWGYAPDYVKGMWLSLQHAEAGDYVFATGIQHSVLEVIEIAFATVGLNWKEHVRADAQFMRPAEPDLLTGSPAKAESVLGWSRTLDFEAMIRTMTLADVEELQSSGSQPAMD